MSDMVANAGRDAPDAPAAEKPADLTAWLAVAAGSLGSLMATLDISIVNSALPVIQGEIGASPAEGTWIVTSYLVAEIIIIPLTGWLERMLGLRRFLLIAAILFTGFSVMCGMASNILIMIIGRTGQGLTGGAMIPTAMTIIATQLPRSQQPIGTAMFGATVILGPVLGPLAGGWLTENISWHYAFFVNVPVSAVLILLLVAGLPRQRAQLWELANADWAGIVGMALGLGCLTVVLEEGHRELWLESSLIRWLIVAMLAGFGLIAYGQFTAARPVVRLALLRSRNFASVALMAPILGAVMFGTAFLVPQFLVGISGYNALQSAKVVLITGIPAMALMPFLPLLVTKADVRFMVALGFGLMAASCWFDRILTTASATEAFVVGQLLSGAGQSLSLMFLNQSAITSVPADDASDASSLFNAARNLGGSVCLALLATFQDNRLEFHRWTLHSAVRADSPAVQDMMNNLPMPDVLSGDPAAAYQMIDGAIMAQATVMAFSDNFLAIAVSVIAITPLALLLSPLPKGRISLGLH